MMPSNRKFMQRKRAFQLEQNRYNSGIEQSRLFRIKELNAKSKSLRNQKRQLDIKAANSQSLLSDSDIELIEQDAFKDNSDLKAWSLTTYGVVMQRSKTVPFSKQYVIIFNC